MLHTVDNLLDLDLSAPKGGEGGSALGLQSSGAEAW